MKTKIKKSSWILICGGIGLVLLIIIYFISMYFYLLNIFNKKVEPASVKGALAYLESNYGRDDYEVKFLKENFVEPHKEGAGGIDGSYFYKDVPARTETCYLGYSPKDDLYFYVFHSSDKKARSTYTATLGQELRVIGEFEEVKIYAKEVWGDRVTGTDVHLYVRENFPRPYRSELKPIYSNADIDARSAYNRFLVDTEDPFAPEIMYIKREWMQLDVSPCLNVYVDCSLEELNKKMREEASNSQSIFANFKNLSIDILFIANDGIYESDLTREMFNVE